MKPKRLVLFQTCSANPFDANSDDDSLCRSDRMQYGYGNIGQMDLYTAECVGHDWPGIPDSLRHLSH